MSVIVVLTTVLATVLALLPASASATVGLSVQSFVDPSRMAPNDESTCNRQARCDRYELVIHNVGDTPTTAPIEVVDTLPSGITTTGQTEASQMVGGRFEFGEAPAWQCSAPAEATEQVAVVRCAYSAQIDPEHYAPVLRIPTTAPPPGTPTYEAGSCLQNGAALPIAECTERNRITVSGGGATSVVEKRDDTLVSSEPAPFELTDFSFAPTDVNGAPNTSAGAHPTDLTTSFGFSNKVQPAGILGESTTQAEPIENVKTIVVELPAGFLGNVQATPTCPETDLVLNSIGPEEQKSACPPASRIGVVAFSAEGVVYNSSESSGPSAVYNMTPEAGYPAEFAFAFAEQVIYMYATVVHTSSGYRVRVIVPAVPAAVGLVGTSLSFFGDPATVDGASGPHTAFLTNPADCSSLDQSEGLLRAKIEADSWEDPSRWVSAESEAYPSLTACNLLQFAPAIELVPSSSLEGGTSQADEPTGVDFSLSVPQTTLFGERATPDLKDASVTLPPGLTISPPAADGLRGCQPTGSSGINIEGPESLEIGADGQQHPSRGKCPDQSKLGTVDITTPLLAHDLTGSVFLAQPHCGGSGQPECTESDATNGDLFGIYFEAEGSGVVIKLAGKVAADPQTGQLHLTFEENPQLPFSALKVHLDGGPRAPLATPQSCGPATTTSSLTTWASPEAPTATPTSSFDVNWDGSGGTCPGVAPFAPTLSAGTLSNAAAHFSPLTMTFSRGDREQDLSEIGTTLPPGLLGVIAGVPRCPDAQANSGGCGPESQIGTVSVLAGAGDDPLFIPGGHVYLTTGYRGAPFGLSIVVPAVAGPFNLGNVVVRAAIEVNPTTSAITVVSDPLPQSRDGVPFRLRTVHVEIDRPSFIFNPTNCEPSQFTGTAQGTGAPGQSEPGQTAPLSSRFAVGGCRGLGFSPKFSVTTQSNGAFNHNGASLNVKISTNQGPSSNPAVQAEANIRKVEVQLPIQLPSRLTTLQKACTEKQFAANPAGCPAESNVGTATARTSVLPVPLSGPAYLVSHGSAAFPDLVLLLYGDGVTIILTGHTDIKKGLTYSRFETVPDAPVSSFELNLPEGKFSALGTNGTNLCKPTKTVKKKKHLAVRRHGRTIHVTKPVTEHVPAALEMPTKITGQNGAVVTQTTKVAVTGCAKPKPAKAKKKVRRPMKKHERRG